MAPRLVSQSPGRQMRKVGIRNSCTGRTGWAVGVGGLLDSRMRAADRETFFFQTCTPSLFHS